MHCIHTAEDIVKLLCRPSSTIILVLLTPSADTQLQGEPHQRGRKIVLHFRHHHLCLCFVHYDRCENTLADEELQQLRGSHTHPIPSSPLPYSFPSFYLLTVPSPPLFFLFPSIPSFTPSPLFSYGSWDRCRSQGGVRDGVPANNAFLTILTPRKTSLVTTDLVIIQAY